MCGTGVGQRLLAIKEKKQRGNLKEKEREKIKSFNYPERPSNRRLTFMTLRQSLHFFLYSEGNQSAAEEGARPGNDWKTSINVIRWELFEFLRLAKRATTPSRPEKNQGQIRSNCVSHRLPSLSSVVPFCIVFSLGLPFVSLKGMMSV